MQKNKFNGPIAALVGTPRAEASHVEEKTVAPATQEPVTTIEMEPTTAQDEVDLIDTIESKELREALLRKRMDGRGRPRKNTDSSGKRTDGYSRTSLIVNDELWAKIKEIAFVETLTMKEIMELALKNIIERYEDKHGVVTPRPERYTDINSIFGTDKK